MVEFSFKVIRTLGQGGEWVMTARSSEGSTFALIGEEKILDWMKRKLNNKLYNF